MSGLTDDDLAGQIEIVQGGAGMDETFNSVRGSYFPAGSSVAADFDVYSNSTFVTADGQALYTDLALPFTDSKARCRNLARIQVERNRDSLVIRYPAKLRAWPLQIGDRIEVTSAEYGFVAKTFRVTDWQFNITAAVVLLLQEEQADIYDLADAATSDPARNTLLPNPWVVAAPTGVTVTSGNAVPRLADGTIDSRVRVAWDRPTDPYLADSGAALIRYRRVLLDADNTFSAIAPVPAAETAAFIAGLNPNDIIIVEVRFRNGLGATSSPVFIAHVVLDNSTGRRGGGGNMIRNPSFIDKDTTGWSVGAFNMSGTLSAVDLWGGVYNLNTRETAYLRAPGAWAAGTQYLDTTPGEFSVAPGRWYQFSAWVQVHRGGAELYGLDYDNAHTLQGYEGFTAAEYAGLITGVGRTDTTWTAGAGPAHADREADYVRLFYTFQARAGQRTHVPVIRLFHSTGTTDAYCFITRAMFSEVVPFTSALVPFDFGAGIWAGKGTATTDYIADNAATVVAVASAASTNLGPGAFTVIPISYNPPAAGTYEITVSGRYSVTTLPAGATLLSVSFSESGAATSYGDAFPQYSLSFAGQVVQVTQALVLVTTGAGPWQIDLSLSIPGSSGSGTMSNLTMRVTQIKK